MAKLKWRIMETILEIWRNLIHRLKPRRTFSWIFSFVVWFLILVYVGFGIYFHADKVLKELDKVGQP